MPIWGGSPDSGSFISACARSFQSKQPPNVWSNECIRLATFGDSYLCSANNLAICFAGRLINSHELAAQFGEPETAVASNILSAYRRWGDDFPRHLLGEFALALWDHENRRLLLARDVSGYRPLHFAAAGCRFLFSSQARELLLHADIPLAPNEERIAHWLCRLPDTTGATFFRGVSSVPPGHTVVWQHNAVTVRDFWRPSAVRELRLADHREYADGLRSVIDQAVSDRLKPFSSVGCHLSGGLDSSTVTATAASILSQRGGTVTAFTAVPVGPVDETQFPTRFCNESAHAAATVALYPNIQHVLVPNVSGSLFHALDRMSSAAEAPQLNPGNTCWFLAICEAAARSAIPVMLTGAIGNFTISYDGRRLLSSLLSSGRIPALLRHAFAQRRTGSPWRSIVRNAISPLLAPGIRHAVRSLRRQPVLAVEDATGMRAGFAAQHGIDSRAALDLAENMDSRSLRLWCIRRNDFGGHIAGLRNLTGVEQMDPTTDRRVIEFCLSVPEEHFRWNGRSRSLLRDAMSERLPKEVLEERRIGRQSADLVFHLSRERAEIQAELRRMGTVDLLARCLDLPVLNSMVERWPDPPYGRSEHDRYGTQLMRAISLGRFVRRVEEGTIFSQDSGSRLSGSIQTAFK